MFRLFAIRRHSPGGAGVGLFTGYGMTELDPDHHRSTGGEPRKLRSVENRI